MKILVLGVSGMAGHVVALYLKERGFDVVGVARSKIDFCDFVELDVLNLANMDQFLAKEKFDYVINCVGALNKSVDEEMFRGIFLNSAFPHYLADKLSDKHTKIIHISTDCVFRGDRGSYDENAIKDANSMYGMSKALGEIIDEKNLTFRTSIIGPEIRTNGIGLFHWFMKQEKMVDGFANVIWTGITTLELAKAIEAAIIQDITGLYHLVNNRKISKYNLLKLLNRYMREEPICIRKSDTIFSDKSLTNTRQDFDFHVSSYEMMIEDLKKWIINHPQLYGEYVKNFNW